MALGTAGSLWVGGMGAQLCPALGQSQNLGDPAQGWGTGVGTVKVWSQESCQPHSGAIPVPSRGCSAVLALPAQLCRLRAPSAPSQEQRGQCCHNRAQARAGGTDRARGGGDPRQQNTSRDKNPGKRCCQVLGVSLADPSLQQCWEFMNPQTSRGRKSQIFIAETNGSQVPALCSEGQMGFPDCRWPLVQR